ncbi:MAG: AsmA-like C-terminal region-containing protein [Parafilimonas sp.]
MNRLKSFKFSIRSKLLRRILRVTAIIIGLYILLLIGLSIYISSSQKRLIGFLDAKLKETILGELKIDNADITVWRTFPDIGITLRNVSISDSFYHKPFLTAKEITAKAGFLGLIGNKLKISSVQVKDAVIHTFTDAKGYSNLYVLKSQNKEKRQSKKPVVFSNLELDNVTVIIEDALSKKRYQARIDNADIDMRLTGSKYKITFDEDLFLRGLGFNLTQGYWLENQRIQAKWKIDFDTAGSLLTINETKVKIQGQPFTIKGEFDLGAKSQFNLSAVTKGIPYNTALAILKPRTRQKLQKINLAAPVDVVATLSGSLSKKGDPSVKVDFKTEKSDVTTPVLNLNNCNFSGTYTNQFNPQIAPDDSNSRVNFNSFTSNWGEIKLKAPKIIVTNLRNPVIDFEFFSACTLPQLDDALSSATVNFLEGDAKLYLSYKGPLIADPSLLNQLNAKIQIHNGKVVYVPRSLTFSECNGDIDITGNNLVVNNLQCNLNTNHFVVNITGNNLNRISEKQPGKADINCNVFSPALDLSDFKGLFAEKVAITEKKKGNNLAATSNAIDNAVENGNLLLNLKANKITLHNFLATNVVANLLFTANDWQIQKAALQHADGSFNLTAKLHQVSDAYQTASMQMDLSHINVQKLFYGFDNFGQTAITSKNLKGIMNAKANIVANFNSQGKVDMNSMNGKMYFSLKNGALINNKSILEVQQYIFKNRDLKNIQFAELKDTFDIRKGDIYIHRMPIQSSAITMYIEGIYSFADRTDISIQVPLSTLVNKPDDDFKKINKRKAEKPGTSIYLRAKDKDGQVKIGLDLFRKLRGNQYKNMLNDSL